MFSSSVGYFFECRKDSKNAIGVMENFKVLISGNRLIASMTCCVDFYGNLIMPAYIDASMGFQPVCTLFSQNSFEDDVERFVQSHRPTFGVLNSFAMIAVMKLKFSTDTQQFMENESEIVFYAPKAVIDSMERYKGISKDKLAGSKCPAILCEKVNDKAGELNTFTVCSSLLMAYKYNAVRSLSINTCRNKTAFMCLRSTGIGAQ